MTRPRKPGASSLEMFRQERRQTLRRDWRPLAVTVALTVGFLAWIVFAAGWSRVIAAFLLGAYVTLLVVVWVMGFDARSLRWRWGAVGEQWTADELARLGSDWAVYHDLQDSNSRNFDHVVIGPPGVFLIDSKNLRAPAWVGTDGLRAGNLRAGGAASRAAAARLSKRLEQEAEQPVWVHAVVAVWGELKGGPQERDRVRYIPGAMITLTLEHQPARLQTSDRQTLIAALDRITAARS